MANETQSIQALHVGRLLSEPGGAGLDHNARITIHGGKIAKVETGIENADAGAGLIALPALCDLHDHGRGLHHIAFGARDEQFELWRQGLYAHPPVDTYLNAALAFGRLARAGSGSVMHVHSSILVDRLLEDAKAVSQAARDVGVRLAFAVPLRAQQTLGAGDDEALLTLHDARDQETIRKTWLYEFPDPATYVDLVRAVAAEIEGPTISVQYGPNSPQACSDPLIEAMVEASAADGRRLTAHLLETQTQRQWANAMYPGGFLDHLDRLGLINDRFCGAHGVWLNEADIDLMAERGAMVSVNTSSNLRLRSGIAPVYKFIKAGMEFGFGLDSFSFDDDDDAFQEMRISHWMHSLDQSEAPLRIDRLFRGWHANGFRGINNQAGYGTVTPGAPADLVVLDYNAMAHDVIDGMAEERDVLLTRAGNRYIQSVIVAGREIVRDGVVLGIDLPTIEAETLAQARAATGDMQTLKPVLDRSKAPLTTYYRSGGHRKPPLAH